MTEFEKEATNMKELHDDEVAKTAADSTEQIYLELAGKDDEWKAAQTKKLMRKLDMRLLPLLVLMYLLNFLDRSNLAQARLGGLEKDLGMGGTDFNLATSILFVVSSNCEKTVRWAVFDNNRVI